MGRFCLYFYKIKGGKRMKKRIKNKLFLLALTGFIYQVLRLAGVEIQHDLFQTFCDLISYILIGTGIYSSFEDKGDPKE